MRQGFGEKQSDGEHHFPKLDGLDVNGERLGRGLSCNRGVARENLLEQNGDVRDELVDVLVGRAAGLFAVQTGDLLDNVRGLTGVLMHQGQAFVERVVGSGLGQDRVAEGENSGEKIIEVVYEPHGGDAESLVPAALQEQGLCFVLPQTRSLSSRQIVHAIAVSARFRSTGRVSLFSFVLVNETLDSGR